MRRAGARGGEGEEGRGRPVLLGAWPWRARRTPAAAAWLAWREAGSGQRRV